ncbi:MAG: radical SAM protein [Elusimicrobiales bacterium]|nr:radical SAM protein [Elusimicrobiales bacterium]
MKKMTHPVTRPAFEVEVFLTNRCNLACSYCSSRHLRDDSGARKLTMSQLRRFVDILATDRTIKREFAGPVRIEFAGGEPLMEFENLIGTVEYIRSRRLDFEVAIATNGTLLTPERADRLVRAGVDIRVSLDGLKSVNDRHRRFAHDPRKSVFDAVMKNLRSCFPTDRHRAYCNISPTLDPGTISTLPDVIRFFRGSIGVKKLRIGLEAFGEWDRAGLSRLRLALRRSVADFLAQLGPGGDPAEAETAFSDFPIRQDIRCYREGPERPTVTLALLYDGHFYPSPDFVVAPPPPEKKYRVGDLERGIDFGRVDRAFAPMLRAIDRKCAFRSGPRSPVEGYYWGLVNDYAPERIDRILESTSEVNRIFGEEAGGFLLLHRIYSRLMKEPGFGDLAHAPKHAAPQEARALGLIAGEGLSLARLRRAADLALYSPGRGKRFSLPAALFAGEGGTGALAVYLMMKSAWLGKRLRIEAEAPKEPI